jgi:hypothetical protein
LACTQLQDTSNPHTAPVETTYYPLDACTNDLTAFSGTQHSIDNQTSCVAVLNMLGHLLVCCLVPAGN